MARRLLLITPFFSPNVGGVETRLDDLVRAIRKHGHGVHVLTYQPLTTKSKARTFENAPGLSIWRIPWPGGDLFHRLLKWPLLEVLYLTPALLLGALLVMILHGRRIDVIHTPGLNAAIVGRCLKALFGKRWLVSTHTIYGFKTSGLFTRVSRWFLGKADCIVALSKPSRDELVSIGLSPRIVSTQFAWVDQQRFQPMDKRSCRDALHLDHSAFLALFVGRLLPEKGAAVVVEAAQKLPSTQFLIVGLGPEERRISEWTRNMPNVRFVGPVRQQDLPLYYNAADVFILPSLYREGLGRVVLEALSCGVPVVVSDRAAIADVVAEAAFAVSPEASVVAHLLGNMTERPAMLQEKRMRARPLAERLFGEGNVLELFRLYGWPDAEMKPCAE